MALHHFKSGEIVDLLHPGQQVPENQSTALFKTDEVEVIRRVLRPDESIPQHEIKDDMTLQCLTGSIKLIAHGKTQLLAAGQLTYIAACEPYAFATDKESVILMTIVRK